MVPDKISSGETVPTIGGYDAAGVAFDACVAAGLPEDWRGDLTPIANWLRDGIDPKIITAAVSRSNHPRIPGSWRYYDARVRELAAKLYGAERHLNT
jgi:hypothetical protein